MSDPGNPRFGFPQPDQVAGSVARPDESGHPTSPIQQQTTINIGVEERFPAWGVGDLFLVLAVFLLSTYGCYLMVMMFMTMLPAYKNVDLKELGNQPLVVVSYMVGTHLLTLGFVYRLLAHRRIGFFEGLRWRWPAWKWPLYLAGGVMLSVVVQGASTVLPIPKELPIDTYFRSTAGAWMMALFGTFVAPFAEEVLFRGLLYPVLRRRLGLTFGVALTGIAFGLLHASQLGRAWSPVLLVLIVGVTLTLVREYANSLAASVLVHAAYNGTIFAIVMLQTHWFQHMDRLH